MLTRTARPAALLAASGRSVNTVHRYLWQHALSLSASETCTRHLSHRQLSTAPPSTTTRKASGEQYRRLKRHEKLADQQQYLSTSFNPYNYRVTIIGRPNVGKSTLYNQLLINTERAIVHRTAGVTRDRKEGYASLYDCNFTITDTAGLEEIHDTSNIGFLDTEKALKHYNTNDTINGSVQLVHRMPIKRELQQYIRKQTDIAIAQADVILFVIDAREGLTPYDYYFSKWLRKHLDAHVSNSDASQQSDVKRPPKQVILVANKAESSKKSSTISDNLLEAQNLGWSTPITISAEQQLGMDDLYQAVKQAFSQLLPYKQLLYPHVEKLLQSQNASSTPAAESDSTELSTTATDSNATQGNQHIKLAIVGRPNVGKSTLVNSLINDERCLVGDQPGVTRDSLMVQWKPDLFGNSPTATSTHSDDAPVFTLVDTAGLKGTSIMQRSKYSKVDAIAMQNSLQSIEMANVVCLVLDAAPHLALNAPTAAVHDAADLHLQATASHFASLPDRMLNYSDPNDVQLVYGLTKDYITADDLAIARHTINEGRALVLLLNKFDAIPKAHRQAVLHGLQMHIEHLLPQVKGISVLPVSAKTRYNLNSIALSSMHAQQKWDTRLITSALNSWLRTVQLQRPHPVIQPANRRAKPKRIKIKFITQIRTRPPTFIAWSNHASEISDEYTRYLTNQLRNEFNLNGVPIRLQTRQIENPYQQTQTDTSKSPKSDTTTQEAVQQVQYSKLSAIEEQERERQAAEDQQQHLARQQREEQRMKLRAMKLMLKDNKQQVQQ